MRRIARWSTAVALAALVGGFGATAHAVNFRAAPSTGGAGSVSDSYGAGQAGGTSTTAAAGGVTRTGRPDPQSSGQSGDSVYPF